MKKWFSFKFNLFFKTTSKYMSNQKKLIFQSKNNALIQSLRNILKDFNEEGYNYLNYDDEENHRKIMELLKISTEISYFKTLSDSTQLLYQFYFENIDKLNKEEISNFLNLFEIVKYFDKNICEITISKVKNLDIDTKLLIILFYKSSILDVKINKDDLEIYIKKIFNYQKFDLNQLVKVYSTLLFYKISPNNQVFRKLGSYENLINFDLEFVKENPNTFIEMNISFLKLYGSGVGSLQSVIEKRIKPIFLISIDKIEVNYLIIIMGYYISLKKLIPKEFEMIMKVSYKNKARLNKGNLDFLKTMTLYYCILDKSFNSILNSTDIELRNKLDSAIEIFKKFYIENRLKDMHSQSFYNKMLDFTLMNQDLLDDLHLKTKEEYVNKL